MRILVTGLTMIGLAASPIAAAPTTAAAPAKEAKPAKPPKQCKQAKKKRGFGKFLGKVATTVAATGMQRAGVPISWGMANSINLVLTDALSCKLEPVERERAAAATTRVVDEPVGATQSWTSETRPDVSGSSTVFGATSLADGSTCKDVRDIATINGEETVVTKRMCKAPGASAYVMQAGAV